MVTVIQTTYSVENLESLKYVPLMEIKLAIILYVVDRDFFFFFPDFKSGYITVRIDFKNLMLYCCKLSFRYMVDTMTAVHILS